MKDETDTYVEYRLRRNKIQHRAIKVLLIGCNIITGLAGLVMMAFGIYVRSERGFTDVMNRIQDADVVLTQDMVYTGAYLMIATGAFITIAGFAGCVAILHSNLTLLKVYLSSVIVILLCCTGAGIYVYVQRDYISAAVKDSLNTLMGKYKVEDRSAIEAMNIIQSRYKCCGANDEHGWGAVKPPSCSDYKIGCSEAFFEYIWHYLQIIAALGIAFALVQVVAVVLVTMFIINLTRDEKLKKELFHD